MWAGHKPPTVPGPHPPPFPGTMAETQPVATAGGGGHEHEGAGREGSRVEDHLGPRPPSSRTWLVSPRFLFCLAGWP